MAIIEEGRTSAVTILQESADSQMKLKYQTENDRFNGVGMRKAGLRIAATGRAFPARQFTNEDLKKYMDTDDEWIYTRTGIHSRYFCTDLSEGAASLAVNAAGKALDCAAAKLPDFDKSKIIAVIGTSCSSDHNFPSIASLVQHELRLPQDVLAFDMNAACSGFVFALTVAHSLLVSRCTLMTAATADDAHHNTAGYLETAETAEKDVQIYSEGQELTELSAQQNEKNAVKSAADSRCTEAADKNSSGYVLIVSSEQLSNVLDLSDRGTGILFGDGAGAALVELCDNENAAAFTQAAWSDGNKDVLSCPGAGTGTLRKLNTQEDAEQLLKMNGHEVFRFAAAALPQTIDRLLNDSGLTIDDVDCILCHQANRRIIDHVKKRYKGSEDKFLMNIDHCGNTSSASIPILLDEMTEAGVIRPGMKLLCAGFGAGLAWGGAIVNT